MIRWITLLCFAGCLALGMWAQTSPSPAGTSAPAPATTQQPTAPAQTSATTQQPVAPAPASQAPASTEQPNAESKAAPRQTTEYPLDKFQQFSAVMTGGRLPGGNWEGHVYRSGSLFRMQAPPPQRGYFVTDSSKPETHGLSITGCLKMPYLWSRTFPFFLPGTGFKYEISAVGEETVDGHPCRVEDITIHGPKNPAYAFRFRMYEAEDLQGFPIKMEDLNQHEYRWSVHYTNVKLEPQDPTLFIFPDKCQSTEGWIPVQQHRGPPPNTKTPEKPQQ